MYGTARVYVHVPANELNTPIEIKKFTLPQLCWHVPFESRANIIMKVTILSKYWDINIYVYQLACLVYFAFSYFCLGIFNPLKLLAFAIIFTMSFVDKNIYLWSVYIWDGYFKIKSRT